MSSLWKGRAPRCLTGVTSINDFDFTMEADAVAASQALLDQVFLDTAQGEFDSDPGLTFGCINTTFGVCAASTPFGFGDLLLVSRAWSLAAAVNVTSISIDVVFSPDVHPCLGHQHIEEWCLPVGRRPQTRPCRNLPLSR